MTSFDLIPPSLPDPHGIGEEPLAFTTRLYILFLQGLFKYMPEGSWRWSEDEHLTEIVITDQVPIPRDQIERRPGIVVAGGPAQYGNLSLDQMRTIDKATGAKTRTDLIAISMQISCLAKLGPEARRIGWICMRHIRTFKTMLQRAGLFKVGDDVSIGPESPPGAMVSPEPDSELVLVQVTSPCFIQWTERDTPQDAPALRAIEAHIAAGINPLPVSAQTERDVTVLRPPTVRGTPVGRFESQPLRTTVKT